MHEQISSLADEIKQKIVEIRHDIHSHPETGYNEQRTAQLIEAFLDSLHISHDRYGVTGVAAVIGSPDGRIVAIRSEMDALNTIDLSGTPHASLYQGVSHACGHDGHISILLGTAWILKKMENSLKGQVKLIWQPAEEGGAGSMKMIEDGVLESPSPEAIFALHGWPGLDVGKAAIRFGPAMASTDDFEIIVHGRSSHAAMPHTGADPIVAAARIIEGLQSVRTRMITPVKPLVISVTTINGGTAFNIIPDEVKLTGTIRCIDPETRKTAVELVENMVVHTALSSGCTAEFIRISGYPPVINDLQATAFAKKTLTGILGEENVVELDSPVMGGEDFAYFLERIPGSFMRLGVGDRPPLHNSKYDFNDEALVYGMRIMAGVATEYLSKGL